MFNIKGEKTRPSKRLCDTCLHSNIMKGPQQGQEVVICGAIGTIPIRIDFPVVVCKDYEQIGQLTEWEAKRIGWVLEVKGGKVLGFKPPKKSSDE